MKKMQISRKIKSTLNRPIKILGKRHPKYFFAEKAKADSNPRKESSQDIQ